jgi:NADH-quinone oxidoreductase subunit F
VFISAIGQTPDVTGFAGGDLEIKRGNVFAAEPRTLATNIPGVFTGGDCVTGPATVIEAIAAGKKAAITIDEFLGGDGVVVPPPKHERKLTGPICEEKMVRYRPKELDLDKREGSFAEVEQCFDAAAAQCEAARCLRCDVKE